MGIRSSPEQAAYSHCFILIPVPPYLEPVYQKSISSPLGRIAAGLNLSDSRSRHISLGFLTPVEDRVLFSISDSLRKIEEAYIGQEVFLNGYGQFKNGDGLVGGTYLPVWDAKMVEDLQDRVQHTFRNYLGYCSFNEKTEPHCTTARLPATALHQNVYSEKQAEVAVVHQEASLTFLIDHLEIRGQNRFSQRKTKYPSRIDDYIKLSTPLSPIRVSA